MKLWAGFVNGKIATMDTWTEEGNWKAPDIFPRKKWAQEYYDDVREVVIIEKPCGGRYDEIN